MINVCNTRGGRRAGCAARSRCGWVVGASVGQGCIRGMVCGAECLCRGAPLAGNGPARVGYVMNQ